MSIELKPCPFCGSTEIGLYNSYGTRFTKPFLVAECRECGASIVDSNKDHCLNDVAKQWNRRT